MIFDIGSLHLETLDGTTIEIAPSDQQTDALVTFPAEVPATATSPAHTITGANPTLLPDAGVVGGVLQIKGSPLADYRGVVEITRGGISVGVAISATSTTPNAPNLVVDGEPTGDNFDNLLEITTAGAIGVARFRYSNNGGATWLATNVLSGGSHRAAGRTCCSLQRRDVCPRHTVHVAAVRALSRGY
jgi:hypothetical protein